MPRIVITGSGAICGAGKSPREIVDAALERRSAVAEVASFDASHWPRRYAAEVTDYNAAKLAGDRKLLKLIRRSDVFGMYAATQAIDAAGFARHRETLDDEAKTVFAEATGCYVGSGGGAFNANYDFFPLMAQTGGSMATFGHELSSNVNPMWLLQTLPNNVLCHVGIRHNLKGVNGCITHHTTSGLVAMIEAAAAIRDGEAERVVAAGHEAPIEPQMMLYYHRCGLMAAREIRPFDERRDGSLLGEGAAAVVLESEASARSRDAKPLGEYLGGGCASEGLSLLALDPSGDGAARAIAAALDDAGLAAPDVGMVVAHGNGTPQSDATEAAALRTVFGATTPPVTAFKWATGHPLAASGILDATLGLEAARRGVVPGIATLAELDAACAGVTASREAQTPASDIVLVICRGFGSTNAAVLMRALR
ncbi:MAG TPA: beta-ketoacyl synthase N-terminal-like domain-containing protein [Casimicrobiaceae bacterium]|nr:beta-ketoacyl synthase N-terminal-like domain-containing protein [Casimicrobiaceae bacterium]